MLKIVRTISSLLLSVGLYFLFAFTFASCDDKEVSSVDLKEICKLFPSEQVKLTLNGRSIEPAQDIKITFPGTEIPEEEIFESELSLQLLPLWPNYTYSNPFSVITLNINAISRPDRISFTGEVKDVSLYSLRVEGCYENDILKLDLTYTAKESDVVGNTYEVQFNTDALVLDWFSTSSTIEWEGKTYPAKQFVRESLESIFSCFTENTGKDAARITFLEDGTLNVSLRDIQSNTYTPLLGHYAYRFHKDCWGLFEVGLEEATSFSDAFLPCATPIPNGLFWFACRGNAFIPVNYRTKSNGDLLMTLNLQDYSLLKRFLEEWIGDINHQPRLDKVHNMIGEDDIIYLLIKKQ